MAPYQPKLLAARWGENRAALALDDDAVRDGLAWLARHQEKAGAFGKPCDECKLQAPASPAGATAFGVLAFLGAGVAPTSREKLRGIALGGVVTSAAARLLELQDRDGAFDKAMTIRSTHHGARRS